MGYDRYSSNERQQRGYGQLDSSGYGGSRDLPAQSARYDGRGYGDYGRRDGLLEDRTSGDRFDQRSSSYYGGHDPWNDRGASQDRYRLDQAMRGDDRRGYDGDQGQETRYDRAVGGRPSRQPGDYAYGDRGFMDRAGDEIRSWFGDRDAERRREQDARFDQLHDSDYHNWRSGQMAALDRDYDEYRRENRSRFENEFTSWRSERQGQRDSLNTVSEHMEVVGSDGSHVGKVDKVRGDHIILTKSDGDAGGRHHSIPSRWIQTVDDKVTLRKTADEAQREWRDEERSQAFFSEGRDRAIGDDNGGHMLGRSFSGTY